jgi:hypothetical protein
MDDDLRAAGVEDSTDRISADLQERFPEVVEVYLDVTSRPGRQLAASTPDATSDSTTAPSTIR